jgi:hypothetical protein
MNDLKDYIKSQKSKYIELFNKNPKTDAGNSVLEFYRGALHAFIEIENKLNKEETDGQESST